ncbi:MAG: hypothetical protein ACM3MJ_02735 [Deltaproteobacteria bacterium]
MPRYIAIHPHACTERDLRRLTARHDEMPEDTLWNRSWCGVNEPVAYCDWEAVDEQAVARVLGAFRVPYSAIHRVTYFKGDATEGLAARTRVCRDGNGSPRRFIAVHPVSLEEEPLKRLVTRWREELPRDVLWRCTWAGVDAPISFCDWEAPCAEAVAFVFGKTGVPCDALHEVRYFDRRLSVWHDPERPLLEPAVA